MKRPLSAWLKLAAIILAFSAAAFDDCICCSCNRCGNDGLVTGEKVLHPRLTQYRLEAPDADKDCHGDFLLRVSWVNEERRKDPNALSPYSDSSDMYYDFRATEGSFVPFVLPPKQYSGGDEYYWQWDMNIGAKNEQNNPTNYQIKVWCNGLSRLEAPPDKPDWWDIKVEASIIYTKYIE